LIQIFFHIKEFEKGITEYDYANHPSAKSALCFKLKEVFLNLSANTEPIRSNELLSLLIGDKGEFEDVHEAFLKLFSILKDAKHPAISLFCEVEEQVVKCETCGHDSL